MNFRKVLIDLLSFFNEKSIDYALIGAFALKAYGYLRATSDVDFLVRSEAQSTIIAHLESIGYETIHRSVGFSNHVHFILGLGRIDFVYVRGETADNILLQSKRILILDEIFIPVVRPEHLIALKLFAVKNDPTRLYSELADIQQIFKLPELDMDEVRSYFLKFGQMERFYELTAWQDSGPQP